ncbi:MAG: thiamine diphosphokinase [Desulfobacter sp.]
MKTVIVANGSFTPTPDILSRLNTADMIIAADGGASHLYASGICPDVIIGDLDSIEADARAFFESKAVPVHTYPAQKDQTDTELCIDYAVNQGSAEIILTGVTGTRLDHTLANVFLLRRLLKMDIKGSIVDAHNEIFITACRLTVSGAPGEILSVVPVSGRVTGLTLEGLEYPLTNKTISMGDTLGISNVFTGSTAQIRLDSGIVLIIKSAD